MRQFLHHIMPVAAFLALTTTTATAATGDADIAQEVANEFFAKKNFQSGNRHGIKSVTPDTHLVMIPEEEEFFIFNSDSENRFVIVGGEKTGFTVLGYSDAGTFDPDKIPPQAQWLFDQYSQEIRQYRSRRHSPDTQTAETATLTPVAPLLGRIAWDQNAPYNLFCPLYIGNYRAATGCAATAMAQIMRYHKYPETGHGTHSYTPTWYEGIGTLTVDYSQSHYDWELMKEQYATDTDPESPEAIAVASFMRDCGVAINMEYGPQSGANSIDWCEAITDHFGYSPSVAYRQRSLYDGNEWNRIIRDEISAGRPVYVTGFTAEGGHAFVFDGYDADGLIHVNWGWSGMSNGYFRTTALTPSSQGTGGSSGGFNSRQIIITGLRRPVEGDLPAATLASEEGLTASRSKFATTDKINFKLNGKTFNMGWQDSRCDFYLGVMDADNTIVATFPGDTGREIAKDAEIRNLTFNNVDFSTISNGNYTIVPLATAAGGDNFERIRDKDLNYPNYMLLSVNDGNAILSTPMQPKLVLNALSVSGKIYNNHKFSASTTVANDGDVEYYGALRLALMPLTGNNKLAYSDEYLTDLMPGESCDIDMTASFKAEPGSYRLALVNVNNSVIGSPVEIEILAATENDGMPTAVSSPSFADNTAVDKENMKITARMTADGGLFSGLLYIYIYDVDSDDIVYGCLDPQFAQLLPGEETEVVFNGPFENGVPGKSYRAVLVNGENFTYVTPRATARCVFTLSGQSGIASIDTDVQGDAEIFSIDGKRLAITPWLGSASATVQSLSVQPGLYIVRFNDKSYKTIK